MKVTAMHISLIAAMADNNVIGRGGVMPWRLPAPHEYRLTTGKPILMGRRTFAAIGRPLPRRRNIVLTRDRDFKVADCEVFHSFESALEAATTSDTDIMLIGGAGVYAQAPPRAGRIYLTRIHASFQGDTFFLVVDESKWIGTEREDHRADERQPLTFSFIVLERHGSCITTDVSGLDKGVPAFS